MSKKINVLCYVVFITHKVRAVICDPKNLTGRKIISYPTPVIYDIMSLTVKAVKWRTLTIWYPRKRVNHA